MSARFSKSPSPMDEEVAHLEVELLQKKKAVAEVKELRRKEAEEKRHWEEEAKKQEEEVKHREEEEWKKQQEVEVQRKQEAEEAWRKQEVEEAWKKQEAEETQRKQEEAEEERRKKQEEEERIAIIAKAADDAHWCHVEKEQMKQLETTRREELWGKSGGESGGDVGGKSRGVSGMWRCNYCIKKNMACHWPSAGSKAHPCSQCREHKVTCVVGGKGNKKRKEQGSPEKVVWKKTKTVELVAQSSSSKDVTPAGLDINQQLILELQVIHCTLRTIHTTLKEVLSQVDLDWSGKKESLSSLEEDGEELGKEPEEKGEENLEEEMTLDDEVVELAKEKAQEK